MYGMDKTWCIVLKIAWTDAGKWLWFELSIQNHKRLSKFLQKKMEGWLLDH